MKKSAILLYLAVFVFVGAYAAYNIYLNMVSNIDVQYALLSDAYNTVDADCFVIRDENQGEGKSNDAIITNSGNGVYIPYVEDGSRVAAGDTIALFFSSESDAKSYKEKQVLKETLDYYNRLQNQSVLSTLDIDKLEKTINENLVSFMSLCENNDYSATSELLATLKYDISAKKIATGESIDFSKQIKSIESQISKLSGADNYKSITADFPGCYISSVDGFESKADYDSVTSIYCDDVDKLVKSEADSVSSYAIGKIVDEYNWYAVCNVPKAALEGIGIGDTVSVSFENTNVSFINMKVYSVSPVIDGKAAVVFVSNEMNPDIASLRKEKIKIVIDKFEGLRVPREAIRNAENPQEQNDGDISDSKNLGVYIRYGQVVKFRKIDVLYFSNDYVIARRNTESSDALKLYDMIITKGRNLYDGKIIN